MDWKKWLSILWFIIFLLVACVAVLVFFVDGSNFLYMCGLECQTERNIQTLVVASVSVFFLLGALFGGFSKPGDTSKLITFFSLLPIIPFVAIIGFIFVVIK